MRSALQFSTVYLSCVFVKVRCIQDMYAVNVAKMTLLESVGLV